MLKQEILDRVIELSASGEGLKTVMLDLLAVAQDAHCVFDREFGKAQECQRALKSDQGVLEILLATETLLRIRDSHVEQMHAYVGFTNGLWPNVQGAVLGMATVLREIEELDDPGLPLAVASAGTLASLVGAFVVNPWIAVISVGLGAAGIVQTLRDKKSAPDKAIERYRLLSTDEAAHQLFDATKTALETTASVVDQLAMALREDNRYMPILELRSWLATWCQSGNPVAKSTGD